MRYKPDIEKCSLVKIEHEPFLERIVENFVMEKKISWFSPNRQWSYYGELVKLSARNPPEGKHEDCQIIIDLAPAPSRKIILYLIASDEMRD